MLRSDWRNDTTDQWCMIQYFKDAVGVYIIILCNNIGYVKEYLTANTLKEAREEMEDFEKNLRCQGFYKVIL